MTMKTYLHLENGKLVKSRRNHVPRNLVAVVPRALESEELQWLKVVDVVDEQTGKTKKEVIIDGNKKSEILHAREEKKRAQRQKEDKFKKRRASNYYGTISQEDLAKVTTFQDLKRYIQFLLDKEGIE